MEVIVTQIEQLTQLCKKTSPTDGLGALLSKLHETLPDHNWNCVLSRGNWYRLGGVIDGDHQVISTNISRWAQQESEGDVDSLIDKHLDSGYFATRISGKTHYFTASTGPEPDAYLQLEIEELQEVIDRPLIDSDWFPESIEEFLDPLDYPRLEPEPIGKPFYRFRRLTPINKLVGKMSTDKSSYLNIQRLFEDWKTSSAGECKAFCEHWVFALREFSDTEGETRLDAKPVSTFEGKLPAFPEGETINGADLANAIHGYDRTLGYPFAWFFMMVSSKASNYALADAVLRDQMGAYDYLPRRDLQVLREWESKPYAV